MSSYTLEPVGFIRSVLKRREEAPRQGSEGAPDAWLEIEPQFAEALLGMEVGHELIVITWLHEARRDVLKGHPRSDPNRPLTGVFYTRSPARPNPLGLHPVTVREINPPSREGYAATRATRWESAAASASCSRLSPGTVCRFPTIASSNRDWS